MSEELAADTRAELDRSPDRQVKRWLLEIKLAQKREKDWRKSASDIWDIYRGRKAKKSSFNILWANTETLRPALYNSPPKPDVRRRFRQNDMLGKAVGELMERGLTYCTDAYDLNACIEGDVLDSLLPGRGLSRVRYVPKIKTVADGAQVAPASPVGGTPVAPEAFEGNREEVEYEQALCEHVQWDDFLHGPGKTWDEVMWCAFRHRLDRDALIEKFGEEIGKEIKLDATDDDDVKNKNNEEVAGVFKRAELWEIWDKDATKVFFLSNSYKKDLIYVPELPDGQPPLDLKNFYPVPKPLRMIEDTGELTPTPLYELYKQQAMELDLISSRINKIVNACRVRFAHDPTLTELGELMKAHDNEGIPVENARAWMNNGGLEKAIWWMPVEQLAKVLVELYKARAECKQVIYEMTGISDLSRGQTDPNETLGAQQLKADFGSQRTQRMQKEVQRYARDLIRLLAEVIGEHFSQQTLAQMTGMNFPTAIQKRQLQLQAQAAQQQQQPVPPELQNALKMPTWEEIMGVLKSDMQREYRVDVETNSTIAETLSQDMQGLKEVISGLVEFWQGVGPAVQAQAISMEAVKQISMTIVRRARMGLEVEDAIENGMQPPQQQADPKAKAAEAKQQQDAQSAQHQQQLDQARLQHEQQMAAQQSQLEQQRIQMESAARERELQMEAQLERQRNEMEGARAAQQAQMDAAFERFKALLDAQTKIEVAEISAGATVSAAQEKGARESVQ